MPVSDETGSNPLQGFSLGITRCGFVTRRGFFC